MLFCRACGLGVGDEVVMGAWLGSEKGYLSAGHPWLTWILLVTESGTKHPHGKCMLIYPTIQQSCFSHKDWNILVTWPECNQSSTDTLFYTDMSLVVVLREVQVDQQYQRLFPCYEMILTDITRSANDRNQWRNIVLYTSWAASMTGVDVYHKVIKSSKSSVKN